MPEAGAAEYRTSVIMSHTSEMTCHHVSKAATQPAGLDLDSPLLPCDAVTESVSPNQEIHNYYEEVSTHIKYKLNEHKSLAAAWQQHQDADAAVVQAAAALSQAEEGVCIAHRSTCTTLHVYACVTADNSSPRTGQRRGLLHTRVLKHHPASLCVCGC